LYAGGDCIRNGGEIVDAVEDGKIAARAIDKTLIGSGSGDVAHG
jgi:NADPH-dependent glutamate synthase beta subunit-like oxidoreductase